MKTENAQFTATTGGACRGYYSVHFFSSNIVTNKAMPNVPFNVGNGFGRVISETISRVKAHIPKHVYLLGIYHSITALSDCQRSFRVHTLGHFALLGHQIP